jgi:hypothetical protein
MADLGGQKAAECKMLGRLGAERNPLSSYVTRTPWLLGEKKRNGLFSTQATVSTDQIFPGPLDKLRHPTFLDAFPSTLNQAC